MKLRIKGNSVRFRLSKSEVEHFAKESTLNESTSFGKRVFNYAVKTTDDHNMTAELSLTGITLWVPSNQLKQWAGSATQVGISEQMDIGNNEVLHLLIEKDFKCADAPINEDQADFFDNPNKDC